MAIWNKAFISKPHAYFHANFGSGHLQNHYFLAQIQLKTANEFKNHSRSMDRQIKVRTHNHISLFP